MYAIDVFGVSVCYVAAMSGLPTLTEQGHTRLWLAHRADGAYPQIEQFFVSVPATVTAKQRPAFDPKWAALAGPLVELDADVGDAFAHLTRDRPAAHSVTEAP